MFLSSLVSTSSAIIDNEAVHSEVVYLFLGKGGGMSEEAHDVLQWPQDPRSTLTPDGDYQRRACGNIITVRDSQRVPISDARGQSPKKLEWWARVLIWDFQCDKYVSVSCCFGLLDHYWVPNSTWVAFLMVNCCELLLGSSLFSEVLRTSSLLGGLTHEFSARLASTLWLGDAIQ